MRLRDIIDILKNLDEFKDLKFVTNGKLYNYRDRIEEPFSLIVYNSFNEPVIIASGAGEIPKILGSYSSIKYYFALSFNEKNLYDVRLEKWISKDSLDTSNVIKKNKNDGFWIALALIGVVTIIMIFILLFMK
ncbi:MAG: hypothetical protein KAR07_07200 [Spirochaetes bacterium]|nr:hypothetical protein [Spirochaetota bacterium]